MEGQAPFNDSSPIFLGAHESSIPPTNLYHYTTQTGLLGIIGSGEIWMTHTQYLNDTEEVLHAISLIRNEIEERIKSARSSEEEKELRNMLSAAQPHLSDVNVCVCCFSENGDSLAQWRAYGLPTGYSIGFRGSFLRAITERNGFLLLKCIYEEKDKIALVSQIVDAVLKRNLGLQTRYPGNPYIDYFGRHFLEKHIFWLAPVFKNKAFIDEVEWRIISGPQTNSSEQFAFRAHDSMIVPYYRLPIFDNKKTEGENQAEHLTELIVGPTPNKERSLSSVGNFLTKQGFRVRNGELGQVEVKYSTVPFRSW